MLREKPCLWVKHGPYDEDEKVYCVPNDPQDDDYTGMVPFIEYQKLVRLAENLHIDLFYQLEAKYGVKAANEYHSIKNFRNLIEKE